MATWVVDRGLDRLLAQINEAAPGRSKASDGSIGDAAHAAGDSDHNPESPPPPGNPDNQVDARDFTHDPAHGADMGVVSEALRASRDRRISYVIFNRRIFSSYTSTGGRQAWAWGAYSGENPHTEHMHVSVNDVNHDQTQDWSIGIMALTDGQDFIQHVINYRIAGFLSGQDPIKVPPRVYGSVTKTAPDIPNFMAQMLKRIPVDLLERLDAIFTAAQDDDDTTVVLDPAALTQLQQIRDDVAAVPEAVVTELAQDLVD